MRWCRALSYERGTPSNIEFLELGIMDQGLEFKVYGLGFRV